MLAERVINITYVPDGSKTIPCSGTGHRFSGDVPGEGSESREQDRL